MDADFYRQKMILWQRYRLDADDVEWITLKNGVHVPVKDGIAIGGPVEGKKISGGVSGAHDPESKEAKKHAEMYYEEVRKRRGDVSAISRNTGISRRVIAKIRKHIFIDEHELEDGKRRFDASYEMAESWRRLVDGRDIKPHDITLLNHERIEIELMERGLTQREAHIEATREYNYGKESDEYYAGLKKNKKNNGLY